MPLCRGTGLPADFHQVGSQRGRDPGEVEPVRAFKDGVPVKVGGLRLLDGRVGPVIDAHATPLGGALLQEIDAHALPAADDPGGVHPQPPQRVHRALSDGMGGQLGDKGGIQTVVGEGYRHIRLSAAKGGLELVVLEEPVVSVGRQPQHDLSECYHTLAHK